MTLPPERGLLPDVRADWTWASGREDEVLDNVARHLLTIVHASKEKDQKQATDYEIIPCGVSVQMRVRRTENTKRRDVTIRNFRSSGAETELSKIRRGFADVMVFAWFDANDLSEYLIVDLAKMRKTGLIDRPDGEKKNHDGKTGFAWWSWQTCQNFGCVIAGVKHPGSPVSFSINPKFASR